MNTMNLVRYSVGYVFTISGLMKLVNTEMSHTFIDLGLPFPLYFMYVLALTEVICGLLILAKKHVRTASIPLILIMIAALILTKFPLLHQGILTFAFQARLDLVMLALVAILYKSHR
ncbi:DoxX family protein [Robertmurraya massiliosenegalensis]|uniref:DoxX family protein n=1 Tax=Robertmurraya TaxID=2837507 RepID=UPI0039A44B2C